MNGRIKVLIADDHTIVRSGVRLLLDAEPDIDVVGEALDGAEAVELVESLQPDVVLMDITMPGMDGMEATRHIKAEWPEVNVLVLTMHRRDEYFFEILRAGASGYVLKGAETNELIHAVRIVGRGEVFLYPTMTQKLVQDYLERVTGGEREDALTPREQQILRLLAEGYSNKEIAERLVISPSTVYTHRSSLMEKLDLTSRHELIKYARRHGLLRDSPGST
ncbi:MAG: response regulator transcription factor [Candidatus Promineifilaceae bacterium]|nr:response regulator transcription factor [Candidatus Promineifilaceae bacterium]